MSGRCGTKSRQGSRSFDAPKILKARSAVRETAQDAKRYYACDGGGYQTGFAACLHLALSKPSFIPAHQGDTKKMKNMILASIAAGGLAVLVAGPAAAENADAGASASGSFTAKNVNRIRPFGSINTYNVGLAPARVSAWAKTLSADQKQEMLGRCSVIIQNQQNYYSETTTFCQNFAIAIAERAEATPASP
jgi:hypothetical protein